MKRSFIIGFCVFIITLFLTQYLAFQQYQIGQIKESNQMADELSTVSDRLRETLSHGLSATNTLGFIMEKYGVPNDFDSIATYILKYHKDIDILELTQQGVITHIFPMEGNEEALGMDILSSPRASKEALKAIEKGELFYAGPLELVQGGMAVVGRLPIYRYDQFYGFSVVVIKLSTLVQSIGIEESDSSDFIFQLSKVNPLTGNEDFFLPGSFDNLYESAISVEVPAGEWKLYIASRIPSRVDQQSIAFSILGIILSSVLGLYCFQWVRQPERLQTMLSEKTAAITYEKYLLDSIIKSLPGVFYLYDNKLKFIRWNKNFEEVTGYSGEEISKMSPLDFFDGEDKDLLKNKIESVFDHGEDKVEAFFLTKHGEKIPYFFTGHKILYEDKEHLIGTGIDISKRVEAQKELLEVYREHETTLNRISDAVVSLDREWRYQFINEAALPNFPMGREQALGRKILEVQPGLKDTLFWKISKEAMRTKTVREIESYFEPLRRWFLVKVYPSSDGITVFYKDISDRKTIEEETLKLIGRELHDNVVQILTAANMYLNLAYEVSTAPNKHLYEAERLIKRGVEEIRMLSHDLISSFPQESSLMDAFEEIFTIVTRGSNVTLETNFEGFKEGLISERLKLCLYRITQEQFNNIMKYAEAKTVHFELMIKDDQLILNIKDDGVGFDLSSKRGGIGFANIKSRADLFGGQMTIESSPGNGCELSVIFPAQGSLMV